jgi:hypothetical protein
LLVILTEVDQRSSFSKFLVIGFVVGGVILALVSLMKAINGELVGPRLYILIVVCLSLAGLIHLEAIARSITRAPPLSCSLSDRRFNDETAAATALDQARAMLIYAAEQWVKAFNLFVVIAGVIIAATVQIVGRGQGRGELTSIVFGAGAVLSALFFVIDLRAMILLSDARRDLEQIEPRFGVRIHTVDRFDGSGRSRFLSHTFPFRAIFGLTGALCVGFLLFPTPGSGKAHTMTSDLSGSSTQPVGTSPTSKSTEPISVPSSAPATSSGNATSVVDSEGRAFQFDRLDRRLDDLTKAVSKPEKDRWDRLAVILPALATVFSVLMAGGLAFLSYRLSVKTSEAEAARAVRDREDRVSAQQHETRIAEAELVEKCLPLLSSEDVKVRRAGILLLAHAQKFDLANALVQALEDTAANEVLADFYAPHLGDNPTELRLADYLGSIFRRYLLSISSGSTHVVGVPVDDGVVAFVAASRDDSPRTAEDKFGGVPLDKIRLDEETGVVVATIPLRVPPLGVIPKSVALNENLVVVSAPVATSKPSVVTLGSVTRVDSARFYIVPRDHSKPIHGCAVFTLNGGLVGLVIGETASGFECLPSSAILAAVKRYREATPPSPGR